MLRKKVKTFWSDKHKCWGQSNIKLGMDLFM